MRQRQGQEQLTSCRANSRLDQWVQKGTRNSNNSPAAKPKARLLSRLQRGPKESSHLPSAEPRVVLISGLETEPWIAATHILQSQGQAQLVGFKGTRDSSNSHTIGPMPLVSRLGRWRNSSHSLSVKMSAGLVRKPEWLRRAVTH